MLVLNFVSVFPHCFEMMTIRRMLETVCLGWLSDWIPELCCGAEPASMPRLLRKRNKHLSCWTHCMLEPLYYSTLTFVLTNPLRKCFMFTYKQDEEEREQKWWSSALFLEQYKWRIQYNLTKTFLHICPFRGNNLSHCHFHLLYRKKYNTVSYLSTGSY